MNATTVDPARVIRALMLTVTEAPEGQFIVTGGSAEHTVRHDGYGGACDCADSQFNHGRACKHRLARHLSDRLDTQVLEALRIVANTEATK